MDSSRTWSGLKTRVGMIHKAEGVVRHRFLLLQLSLTDLDDQAGVPLRVLLSPFLPEGRVMGEPRLSHTKISSSLSLSRSRCKAISRLAPCLPRRGFQVNQRRFSLLSKAALKRIGCTDVFTPPVVVHLINPVDQDKTRLGKVVCGRHNQIPNLLRGDIAIDPACH